MSYYKVIESWSSWYTHDEDLDPKYESSNPKGRNETWSDDEWNLWHDYILDLIKQKRYIWYVNSNNEKHFSEYVTVDDNGVEKTIYVIKMFKDLEGAQGYVDIITSMSEPVVLKIEYIEE